ncbi:MAG TPA: RhuM family protein [Stellaceae bacterium]|jgi:hypothetical protein
MKSENEREAIKRARQSTEALHQVGEQLEMELVKFRGESQEIQFSLDLSGETVWATQQQIAELFGRDRRTIGEHVSNIFRDKELDETAVCRKFRQTGADGKSYETLHYNLDLILSVGYRVSSAKATLFRQWATQTLRAYILDGYVLNERRLRDDPTSLRQLAAKIRALRADERNVYASVRDCFKESSVDYDKDSQICRSFYARLQDKFVFAITEKTASAIILDRADHKKSKMGVHSTKGEMPTLDETKVGKNYLDSDELYTLHILCEQFLLYAESTALRGRQLTMTQLSAKLDQLLETNEYPVFREYKEYLKDRAIKHATAEYALYRRGIVRAEEALSLPSS